jgi:hypothetical protein
MIEHVTQTMIYAWKQGMILSLWVGMFFGYQIGRLK